MKLRNVNVQKQRKDIESTWSDDLLSTSMIRDAVFSSGEHKQNPKELSTAV